MVVESMSLRTAGVAGLCALFAGVGALAQPVMSPHVVHTGRGPTGYSVTFRYANPAAKTVRVRGDWFFERPGELAQLAASPDHPVIEGQGILPPDWKPGDVPLAHPNGTGGTWPSADMAKGKDGVWTWTTPLPSGVFGYSFIVDCERPQCPRIPDPANPPWRDRNGSGAAVQGSQVYVPGDPAFGAIDYAWQGPAKVKGKLTHETYASPEHKAPDGINFLVVYTPPGYDPKRVKPYPTLWLSHGGGDSEMGWSTQGAVANILDNLIASGEVQPMVVVMPNATGLPTASLYEAYDRDLIERMIPFVERKYHVSRSAMDRAYSGLSGGGMLTNTFMIKHPEVFQYYGMMSAGMPAENPQWTPAQATALKGKAIWVGGGWQDVIHEAGFKIPGVIEHAGPAREVSAFAKAGIPITTTFVHGGHEWYVWRLLLKDFLTRTAFLPVPYANW
jgi:enterochelin esterase-like enzyme